jgi:spore coat protein U-like protein
MNCVERARCALAMAMLFGAGGAFAGCTVTSNGLSFGAYQPLVFGSELRSSESTGVTTVSLACTGIVSGGSYSLALGPSTVGGSFNPRYLAHAAGGPPMAFNVYRDPAYTILWGNGSTGALITGTLPAGNSTQSHFAYGRVPPGQNTLKPGAFTGSLDITITYNP